MDKLVPDAHGRLIRTKFRGPARFEPLLPRARAMRRQPTDAEPLLWSRLRNRRLDGLKFRWQHPFGLYILDFFCEAATLSMEVDGGQHYHGDGRRSDRQRDAFLGRAGVRVLRFSDREVLTEIDGVLAAIAEAAGGRTASAGGGTPSP